MTKDKKKQWNFKNVPADIYEKVVKIQAAMKVAGASKTSLEHICYQLIRKGANMPDKPKTKVVDDLV